MEEFYIRSKVRGARIHLINTTLEAMKSDRDSSHAPEPVQSRRRAQGPTMKSDRDNSQATETVQSHRRSQGPNMRSYRDSSQAPELVQFQNSSQGPSTKSNRDSSQAPEIMQYHHNDDAHTDAPPPYDMDSPSTAYRPDNTGVTCE
jgi:hypothetical protein